MKNEPLLRLREIPARVSLELIVQYISVQLKSNKMNEAGLMDQYHQKDDYKYRGHDYQRHQDGQHREDRQHRQICGDGRLTNEDHNNIDIDLNNKEQAEYNFFAFIAENTNRFGNNPSRWGRKPPRADEPLPRVGDLALSLNMNKRSRRDVGCAMGGVITECAVYASDKKEYFKLHPERVPKQRRMQNWKWNWWRSR